MISSTSREREEEGWEKRTGGRLGDENAPARRRLSELLLPGKEKTRGGEGERKK